MNIAFFGDRQECLVSSKKFLSRSWCLRISDSAGRKRTPPKSEQADLCGKEMDENNHQMKHRSKAGNPEKF
jgi:hypothetical protein